MESLDTKIHNAQQKTGKEQFTMTHLGNAKDVYEAAKKVDCNTAMKMINEAKSEEERQFFAFVMNMNLQRSQKVAVERNLF